MARKGYIAATVVAASIAAVAAAGGTAIGAAYITGKQVKNGTLTGADVKNRSLTRSDFRGSVRGPAGATGPAGPAGPVAVGHLTRVEASATFAAGAVDHVTVACPGGQNFVSGGFRTIGADTEVFYSDTFGSPNTWSVGLDNFDSTISADVTAVAWCAPAGQAVAARVRSTPEAKLDALDARQRSSRR